MSSNLVLYDLVYDESRDVTGVLDLSIKCNFWPQIYAVSYIYQRFQPFWNHSKAFHALQCQNCGYIIDIWGILDHYLVSTYTGIVKYLRT